MRSRVADVWWGAATTPPHPSLTPAHPPHPPSPPSPLPDLLIRNWWGTIALEIYLSAILVEPVESTPLIAASNYSFFRDKLSCIIISTKMKYSY